MNSASYSTTRSRRNAELWIGMDGMGAIYGKVPNAPNSTRVDISPDPKPRPPYTTYGYSLTYNFNDPYIGSDDIYNENYAIGDVKPGTYTITALGGAYTRTATVQSGEVVNADLPTDVEQKLISERGYEIFQNYPNPFNPGTNISFYLKTQTFVKLEIYNPLGEKIETISEGLLDEGYHNYYFTPKNIAGGVYISMMCIQQSGSQNKSILTKKMLYRK